MINITRGETPQSLDTPEIQRYLDELTKYRLLDDEARKTTPKPQGGNYRNEDILEAFDRDFYSKCYLTEQKFANSFAMDIEHFKGKSMAQSPELKYEWTNFYPCSHDANMAKPNKEPEGGYLDPCNPEDDVEKEIVYTLEFGGAAFFDALNAENIKARNTAELPNRVHKGADRVAAKKAETLQYYIQKKKEDLLLSIIAWHEAKSEGVQEDVVRSSRKIKNLLSRKSDFTMLLRSLACVKKLPNDFLD